MFSATYPVIVFWKDIKLYLSPCILFDSIFPFINKHPLHIHNFLLFVNLNEFLVSKSSKPQKWLGLRSLSLFPLYTPYVSSCNNILWAHFSTTIFMMAGLRVLHVHCQCNINEEQHCLPKQMYCQCKGFSQFLK